MLVKWTLVLEWKMMAQRGQRDPFRSLMRRTTIGSVNVRTGGAKFLRTSYGVDQVTVIRNTVGGRDPMVGAEKVLTPIQSNWLYAISYAIASVKKKGYQDLFQ
jgi:hypothetical protein